MSIPKKITEKALMSTKLKEGISLIASIVKRTLGPGGLPVLIERTGQNLEGDPLEPMITKDGVTVANECASEDPEVDLTIQTVKAICRKTNRIAGDGTTTAVVLGEAVFLETLKKLEEDPSLNPQIVREQVEEKVQDVIKKLYAIATPVEDLDMIERVANISANGEKEIGRVLRSAFEHVGSDGVITVDEGNSPETQIERVEGFQFQRGAEGQDRFFNNNERTKFEAQNVHVVIYDGRINNNGQIIPIMSQVALAHKKIGMQMPPILFIANEYSIDSIQFLLINKVGDPMNGLPGLNLCAVKGPNTTTVRTQMLDDLAVYLGGVRLGNGNKNLENAEFSIEVVEGKPVYKGDLGFTQNVVVDRYTTTFYGGGGEDAEVLQRISELKASQEYTFSDYDKSIIRDRIASLSRGIAKVLVGGRTELEIKEKYHRIEDALNASRAAISEGVIPGGGAALYRIAKELEKLPDVASQILGKALKAPLYQILENIGLTPGLKQGEVNLQALEQDLELLYDARERKMVKFLDAGIIDPVKVTVTALQNATSIAGLLSTCGGGITYLRKS